MIISSSTFSPPRCHHLAPKFLTPSASAHNGNSLHRALEASPLTGEHQRKTGRRTNAQETLRCCLVWKMARTIWWHSGSTNTWFWLNSIQRTFLRCPFPADGWWFNGKTSVPIRVRRRRQIVQDQFFAIFRIMFFLGPAKHILGHVRSTVPWFTVLVSWRRKIQSITKNGWLAINWYIWPICFETHCCWGSVAKQFIQLHYKITQSCTRSSHQVGPSSKCTQNINGTFWQYILASEGSIPGGQLCLI